MDTIRSSSWFTVNQAVRVSVDERNYPEFTGQMIELSTRGIRLRADRPLLLGTAVELSWNETALSGEVRRCIETESDFLVECELLGNVRQKRRAKTSVARSV